MSSGRDLESLAAVVELPAETVSRWMCVDFADDVERLASRCSDHDDSVFSADRSDCKIEIISDLREIFEGVTGEDSLGYARRRKQHRTS